MYQPSGKKDASIGRKTTKKSNTATARLVQDYMRLKKDPVPFIVAEPLPNNILEWHYVVFGPEHSQFEGGVYHGKLIFSREFPFKPPSIYMLTPNGRFKINTRLCLSISDFHPDTWNPAWSVSTILTGLLSFMLEESPTLGSIETTAEDKQRFAYKSLDYNLKDPQFCEQFPDVVKDVKNRLAIREKEEEERRKRLELLNSTAPGGGTATTNIPGSVDSASSILYSTISNLVVLVGFAAFVLVVKYVVGSTPME